MPSPGQMLRTVLELVLRSLSLIEPPKTTTATLLDLRLSKLAEASRLAAHTETKIELKCSKNQNHILSTI